MTTNKLAMSRPLRAFIGVVTGWTAMRVAVLWQASAAIVAPSAETGPPRPMPPPPQSIARVSTVEAQPHLVPRIRPGEPITRRLIVAARIRPALEVTAPTEYVHAVDQKRAEAAAVFVDPWSAPVTTARRFSGSAWALFRPNSTAAALGSGGTLGGSQAGMRVFYEPGPKGFALTGRLSAPIAFRLGREASVGMGVRGHSGGLLLERRIALDTGGRNAMSITAYGGVSDIVMPLGFRLNGYAQAGVVGARKRDGFADGLAQFVYPIAGRKSAKLSIGGALSGSVQPGVGRIDAGPELMGDLYIGTKSFRLTAGWRQRLTGNAAPDSGPAVSLGAGF